MNNYLGRLISQHADSGASQEIKPFVRSASPVVEQDQRVGMFHSDGSMASVAGNYDSETSENMESSPSRTADYARVPVKKQPVPLIQRKTMAMPNDSSNPAGQNRSIFPDHVPSAPGKPEIGQHQVEKPPMPSSNSKQLSASTDIFDPAENGLETPGHISTSGQRVNATDFAGNSGFTKVFATGGLSVKSRIGLPRGLIAEPQAGSVEALTPEPDLKNDVYKLMPPKPVLPNQQELSAPSRAFSLAPRVVIDHINVELVDDGLLARQERKPKQVQPLTAESVSRIGPLEGNFRAHLPFRLRYR